MHFFCKLIRFDYFLILSHRLCFLAFFVLFYSILIAVKNWLAHVVFWLKTKMQHRARNYYFRLKFVSFLLFKISPFSLQILFHCWRLSRCYCSLIRKINNQTGLCVYWSYLFNELFRWLFDEMFVSISFFFLFFLLSLDIFLPVEFMFSLIRLILWCFDIIWNDFNDGFI